MKPPEGKRWDKMTAEEKTAYAADKTARERAAQGVPLPHRRVTRGSASIPRVTDANEVPKDSRQSAFFVKRRTEFGADVSPVAEFIGGAR
jgi:hypothetical protein